MSGIIPDLPSLVFRLNENGLGPELLRQVFLERGWSEFEEDTQDEYDWNLWWRTSRFRTSDYDTIYPWQRLNHYPKSTLITKKDALARNLKRMRCVHGATVFNFSPLSFNLPNDYTKYIKVYEALRQKSNTKGAYWICKPADLSRGRGIFIFRDLSELLYDCNAVVQQYIDNPLLIGGYKFDLRIYVAVTSFQPLRAYIHEEGIVRFSTEKFDLNSTKNVFAHLTNTSINKHSPGYTEDKERIGPGCKWTLTQLRHYFLSSNINDQMLWRRIINIVILTLLVQAPQVQKIDNCFELYGFDILIDENLKPWLLEVNFSPSLSADCQADILAKKPMLHHLLDLLHYSGQDAERGGEQFRHFFHTFSRQAEIQRRGSLSQKGGRVGSRREGRVAPPGARRGGRIHSGRTDSSLLGGSRENLSMGLPPTGGLSTSMENVYVRDGEVSAVMDAKKSEAGFGVPVGDRLALEQERQVFSDLNPLPSHLSQHHSKTTISADSHNSGGSEESKVSKVSADSGVGSLTKSAGSSAKGQRMNPFGSLPEVSAQSRNGSGIFRKDSTDDFAFHLPSLESSASSKRSRRSALNPQKPTPNITDNEQPERNSPKQSTFGQTRHKSVSNRSLPTTGKERSRHQPQRREDSYPLTHRSVASETSPSSHTGPRLSTLQRNRSSLSYYASNPMSSRLMMPHPRQPRFHMPHKNTQHLSFAHLKKKVGDFFLVFPFNEATHKVGSTLDAKVVIRETQQMMKEALNTVSNARSSAEHGGHDGGVSKESEGLWSPLRTAKDES